MPRDPSQVMHYIAELEEMAEDILTDKQQIVDLDFRRNKNREAIRSLSNTGKSTGVEAKSWICFSNTFVKMPQEKAKALLIGDQEQLDKEINNLRTNLKSKVFKMRELEGKPELKGFQLQPLSREEMAAVNQVMTGRS